MLKPAGGVRVWHDYGESCWGVTQAMNEFYKRDSRFREARHIEDTTLVFAAIKDGDSIGSETSR